MRNGASHILLLLFVAALSLLQYGKLMSYSMVSTDAQYYYDMLLPPAEPPISSVCLAACRCRQVLGKNGTWVQDWKFAETYGQQQDPEVVPSAGGFARNILRRFEPSVLSPWRWETSWRWVDYNDGANSSECQVDYTMASKVQKVCDIFQSLQIERLVFMGDSLTKQHHIAMVNMLGGESIVADTHIRQVLHCPGSTQNTPATVEILLHQIDGGQPDVETAHAPLNLTDETLQILGQNNATLGRIVVIVNLGAHYHDVSLYQTDIDYLWHSVKSLQRPRDLYFFRTSVPGHYNCIPRNPRADSVKREGQHESPLATYDDYNRSGPDTYDWWLFEDYNEYVRQKKGDWHVLDVFNMTILRHDGHWGGLDCLHYRPAGPIDWWNHLFLTNLKSLIQCPACGR